ncbi:MAG: hypothetical protein KGJ13_00280 [Patescibacteria group bacterium]|nr:hypothetical protein [Patescibacteria group bacterium]
MNRTAKQVIAVIASLFLAFLAVYGSYLPMRKAEIFIGTLQSFQTQPVSSLQELETRLEVPLNYPSPIGQEELVRNTANSVLSFIQQGTDATTTAQLISFLNQYYDPIIVRGKGMSFEQDLYLLGAINEIAFTRTGNPIYLQSSLRYYGEGVQLGPNRPQPLYGLYDVYRFAGDATDTIAVAERILQLWPNDPNIKNGLAQFLQSVEKPTTSGKK